MYLYLYVNIYVYIYANRGDDILKITPIQTNSPKIHISFRPTLHKYLHIISTIQLQPCLVLS